jgi:hypothetical protein
VPAATRTPRWFLDENSLAVALALQHVRGDITWPGAPDGLIPAGATDTTWRPLIGSTGLIVLTRDKRIRTRPVEHEALLDHDVRACFLTSGGNLDLFTQLRLLLQHWDAIETLVDTKPGLARQRDEERCSNLRRPTEALILPIRERRPRVRRPQPH